MLTPEILFIAATGVAPKELIDTFNNIARQTGLTTPERVAAFLAWAAFRSEGFRNLTGGLMGLGENNLNAFHEYTGRKQDDIREYVKTPIGAVESAIWYWNVNKLNRLADTRDFAAMAVAINGVGNHLPWFDVEQNARIIERAILLTKSPI